MTISGITPAAGATLAGTDTPFSFSSSVDLSFINVAFGNTGFTEEPAFRDGSFRGAYAAYSTKVGNVYTLRRNGGWPAEPAPVVEEKGGATATLQALNYSPLAAWSLEQKNGVKKLDRSGNGHDAATALLFNYGADVPSRVPGKSAPFFNGTTVAGNAPFTFPVDPTGLNTSGFSFAAWICYAEDGDNGFSEQWPCGWATDSAVLLPVYLKLGVSGHEGQARLCTYGGGSSSCDSDFYLNRGEWNFVGVSYAAGGGSCTLAMNGAYQDFADSHGLVPPTGTGSTTFGIGAVPLALAFNHIFCGAIADGVLWAAPRSHAELTAQLTSSGGSP